MPEYVRTVISHLHSLVTTPTTVSRRASLPLTISLLAVNQRGGAVIRAVSAGRTHDLSRTGLSFIVGSLRVGNSHIFYDLTPKLLVRIELPSGPVEMYVKPVRFDSWGGGETDSNFIVGVRIVEISRGDRARYTEFLRGRRSTLADVINSSSS